MKPVHLKAGNNIFRNVVSYSKTFEFGIKQEGIDDNQLIKQMMLSMLNKKDDFFYHFHYIGIDTSYVLKEINFLINDAISEFIKKITVKGGYNEYMKGFVDGINKNKKLIIDNIIGIFENIIYTKSYFSYSIPKIYGSTNNPNVVSAYKDNVPEWINKLIDGRIEDVFKKNPTKCYIKEAIPEIFPSYFSISGNKNITIIPEEDIDKENIKKNQEITLEMYQYFLDNIVGGLIEEVEKIIIEKKYDLLDKKEFEKKGKEILLNTFNAYSTKILDFSYKTFFDNGYLNFNGNYLYENTASKVIDLVYLGKQDGNKFISKVDFDFLRRILLNGIKKGYYNNFVLKVNLDIRGNKVDIMEKGYNQIIHTSDGIIETNLEEIEDVKKLKEKYGNIAFNEMKFGITIGFFSESITKINEGLKYIAEEHKKENMNIYYLNNCNYDDNN